MNYRLVQRSTSPDAQLGQEQYLPHCGAIARAVANARMHPVALRVLGKQDIAGRARFGDSGAAGANPGVTFGATENSGQREIAW
jgi:hypothetical protein